MKVIISLVTIAVGFSCLYPAFHSTHTVWQSFYAGLASSLVVLGIGILAVNIYLESAARRGAIRALFGLSHEAIATFHNELLDISWAQFGRDTFGKLLDEFSNSHGDVSALKKDDRSKIYEIYRGSPKLQDAVRTLEGTLTELSRMVGWSLDHDLLAACLAARTLIAKLNSISNEQTDTNVDATVRNLLLLDGTTQGARSILMKLAAIKEKDQ